MEAAIGNAQTSTRLSERADIIAQRLLTTSTLTTIGYIPAGIYAYVQTYERKREASAYHSSVTYLFASRIVSIDTKINDVVSTFTRIGNSTSKFCSVKRLRIYKIILDDKNRC